MIVKSRHQVTFTLGAGDVHAANNYMPKTLINKPTAGSSQPPAAAAHLLVVLKQEQRRLKEVITAEQAQILRLFLLMLSQASHEAKCS